MGGIEISYSQKSLDGERLGGIHEMRGTPKFGGAISACSRLILKK
ncbi:MAG: hypothetical protein N2V77_04085 [Canidatus Methanoxibalbensis ujae]|nr:hypothetical protein [Candidatus Methanoxibalbensis ujae]MCW7077978.1 hypothetical protein [Candidatus Methanoxibalbensis ujae]